MPAQNMSAAALRCRRKFLRFFRGGFADGKYYDWERGYKWEAHERWEDLLGAAELRRLIREDDFAEVAKRAVTIESRTNLLFSFEKMALRDAVKSSTGAREFSKGLNDFLHGRGSDQSRFERWVDVVGALPRKQTRVLTWPLLTVFGFLAQPEKHFFLKPNVTRVAAKEYDFEFEYKSKPSWATYTNLLAFGEQIRKDQRDLKPKDMIDLQSFMWVQGSDEYEE